MLRVLARFAAVVIALVFTTPDVQGQHPRGHSHPHARDYRAGHWAAPPTRLPSTQWRPDQVSPLGHPGYWGGISVAPGTDASYYGLPYYGYGYAYDPYRGGRFEAPDLLDDPFFREQHRFDSRYPGRYSRRPPLQFRSQ